VSERQSAPMRTLYNAGNAVEAQILGDVLAQEGVPTLVLGAALQGAVGMLPAGEPVRLMVDEADWERGRAVVARWERGDLGRVLDE
jgi:hypothetical protein